MATDADRLRFVHQTTVDAIVQDALNAIDKPELFSADPQVRLRSSLDRYPAEFGEALERCRKLAADNPRDFVAAGAVSVMTSVLETSD